MDGPDPLQAYINTIQTIQNSTAGGCIDSSYAVMVAEMKDTRPTADVLSSRSWSVAKPIPILRYSVPVGRTYQTCTEYGYFQRTKQGMSPFSARITLDFFEQICKDVFGLTRPDTAWTNTYYGRFACFFLILL